MTLITFQGFTTPISLVNISSPFQSIPGTMWWCIVCITSVGYGDAYPSIVKLSNHCSLSAGTELGKTVGAAAMVMGLVVCNVILPLLTALDPCFSNWCVGQ